MSEIIGFRYSNKIFVFRILNLLKLIFFTYFTDFNSLFCLYVLSKSIV